MRLLWNPWFFLEPMAFSVNDKECGNNKIPKGFEFRETALNDGSIEKAEASAATTSTAATMGSSMPTVSSLPDVDIAPPSPPPERECALWAPTLNFPDFEGPRQDETPLPHFAGLNLEG